MRMWLLSTVMILVTSCSVLRSIRSPSSSYHRFLENRVHEASVFDRGRVLVSVKALRADAELQTAQQTLTPGFSFSFDPSLEQFIVALDMTTWERFSKYDLKFLWKNVRESNVREISNPIESEEHYPFAYPHYRVFLVSFPTASTASPPENYLWIQTLRGEIKIEIPDSRTKD